MHLAWVEQLEEAADGLVHPVDVTSGQRSAPIHPPLHIRHPALIAQLSEALRQEITHQTEVLCKQSRIELGDVPSRQETVNAVHECGVIPHFGRQRSKEVT